MLNSCGRASLLVGPLTQDFLRFCFTIVYPAHKNGADKACSFCGSDKKIEYDRVVVVLK